MKATYNGKDDIQKSFLLLLEQFKRSKKNILTQEEKVKENQNQKLVEEVANHSASTVVQSLATLQLDLSKSFEQLTNQLNKELEHLEQLQTAITVQESNLKVTQNARLAANAFYILKEEQAQKLQQLEEEKKNTEERLTKEIEDMRLEWEKGDIAFLEKEKEYQDQLLKTRTKEEEDYLYNQERKAKIVIDNFENEKVLLMRSLKETELQKEKDWSAREKALNEKQSDFEKYKNKVDNLEKEIEEKTKEARDKAIRQTSKENKDELELLQKEVAGKEQIAALEIENAEQMIAQQKIEIEKLNNDLRETLAQVQQLSLKALEANKK